jgi:outer membrane protein insertion porin family
MRSARLLPLVAALLLGASPLAAQPALMAPRPTADASPAAPRPTTDASPAARPAPPNPGEVRTPTGPGGIEDDGGEAAGPSARGEPDCQDARTREAFIDRTRRFGRVVYTGVKVDDPGRLVRVANLRAGEVFDLCSIAALRERLDRLGYHADVTESERGSVVDLTLRLQPVSIVRHVYVRNNWPIFQEEVLRHVRFRPGTRLPPESERADEFERQKTRLQDFLRKEGYFNSSLDIVVEKTRRPHAVDLLIRLKKGGVYRLGDLRVIGGSVFSPAEVRQVFEHRILWWKRAFTTTRFKEDLKKLQQRYHKKGYPSVRIRHDFNLKTSLDHKNRLVHINLTIRENRRVEVAFEGSRRLSRDELMGAVTFFEEGAADSFEIQQSAREIQRKLQAKGFFFAAVSAVRTRLDAQAEKVTFWIEEGPRLKVEGIDFVGNAAYDDRKLLDVVKTKVYPKLGAIGLGSGGFLSDKQLEQDVDRIIAHYKDEGYLDVTVRAELGTSPPAVGYLGVLAADLATQMERKAGDLHVRFVIREGPRYVVDQVVRSGAPPGLTKGLARAGRLAAGKPFTRKRLGDELERFKRYLANHGYPYCLIKGTVRKSPTRPEDGKTAYIDLQFEFQPGVQVRFGEIFVRGNFKTARSIIQRELRFKTGDLFSLAKVEAARRNLRSLGIFRATRIEFLGLRARENPVHVVVVVTERFDDYGSLEFGAGLSTDNLYFFSLGYRNRNLFGWGKELELKGEAGKEIQSGRITYKDPRVLGSKLTLDLTGFVRREETERLGELLTFGGSVTLLHHATRDLQWFVRYELKRVRRKEELIRVAAGQDDEARVDRFTNVVSIGPTIIWDKRDNPLVPRKGWKLTAAIRFATRYLAYPIQADDFIHLNFSGQGLLPLPAGIVLAMGIRYDQGIPLGKNPMLPKTERFYAGGDTTVRGYEEDRLKTEVVKVPVSPMGAPTLYQVRPRGANVRFLANVELQFPIWQKSILFGMPILGVIFFDAGALTNTLRYWKLDDFKTSVGAALRLVTPVGFISLEYAVPFQPGWGDDPTGRMHFNFGFIF